MMKTILVDALNTFVTKDGGIFKEMYKLLETYPNKKIILTNANDEEMIQYGLVDLPYEIFTLKHKPNKTNPEYYEKMLKKFGLEANEVVYCEHNEEAIKSAKSNGIVSFHYDKEKRDLKELKDFLDEFATN